MNQPNLRNVSDKDKKEILKYYSTLSMQRHGTAENYFIASGNMRTTDYKYLTNPYSLKDPRYQKYPAKLINYDIISPIILQLVGEYSNRPFSPIVYSKSGNFHSEKAAYELELIDQSVQQRFVNQLIAKGQFIEGQVDEEGNPIEPPMSPEVIQNKVSSLKDRLTIEAQSTLDYIITHQNYASKYRKEFYDFAVNYLCCSYKTVLNDEVVRFSVNPLRIEWVHHTNLQFLDESEVIRYTTKFSLSDMIDVFRDVEEFDEILNYCVSKYTDNPLGFSWMKMFKANQGIFDEDNTDDRIPVQHIQFTTYKQVADIITPSGQEVTVDKDYIPYADEDLTWYWKPEKREGWVIDNHFFVGGDLIQYSTGDNKNNYTGKLFMSDAIMRPDPIPQKLAGYQEAYNACKFKIQFTFNKNKDKIGVIPLSLLNNTRGAGDNIHLNETQNVAPLARNESVIGTNLYYMDATSLLFVNDSDPQQLQALQYMKHIDLGLGNYIEFLINYGNSLKAEAEELVGFNRFRKANINSSDAVSNVQQGQYSGSLITDILFKEFDEYKQNDLQGTINLAKQAYKEGKRASFVRSDGQIIMLDVTGDFSYEDFGVFVTDSTQQHELLNMIKQRSNEFLQNGKASTWLKIQSQSKNFVSIIQDIENAEQEAMEMQQQQMQHEQQMNEARIQADMTEKQKDRDLKIYELELEDERERLKLGIEPNDETGKRLEQVSKNINDTLRTAVDERNNVRDNAARRYVADKNLEIAKENV